MSVASPERLTASTTRIAVDRAEGRVRVALGAAASPHGATLRPVLLGSDERTARVGLVAEGALLLGGDDVRIEVAVGEGAELVLVEPAGTVAYDMRGRDASWTTQVELGEDATLLWAGEPFVIADGARVARRTTVRLAPGSVLAMRETVVLGRHGECGTGRGTLALEVEDRHGPILVESLTLGPAAHLPVLLGGHRVIDSVTALGLDLPPGPPECAVGRYDLDRGGVIWRHLAHELHEVDGSAWDLVRRAAERRRGCVG